MRHGRWSSLLPEAWMAVPKNKFSGIRWNQYLTGLTFGTWYGRPFEFSFKSPSLVACSSLSDVSLFVIYTLTAADLLPANDLRPMATSTNTTSISR